MSSDPPTGGALAADDVDTTTALVGVLDYRKMSNADFFTLFGLFAARGVLDAQLCARLVSEVRSSTARAATVGVERDTYIVDENVRRTNWAEVSAKTTSLIEERLLGLMPVLEQHFRAELTECQEPQFLIYRAGDFYVPHRDSRRVPNAAEFSRERQVAVVLFLNGESEEPGPDVYGGGSLTFYGLIDDPRMDGRGIPLIGEPGLLVAFLPDLVHQVTPVTHGERYTVVTWFR